jgi:steroid delta-isomerase-like uncharacterized protein
MASRINRSSILFLILTGTLFLSACDKKSADKASTGGDSTATTSPAPGGMTAEETNNAALAREFVEKVFAQGDTAYLRAFTDPNYVEHNPAPNQQPGVDGLVKMVVEWRNAFPDMKISVDDVIASGDRVCVRSTMNGTNTGPMMGQPATGKPISVEGIDIVRIKDGKQVEHWGQFDTMKMLQQMGMMPDNGAQPSSGMTADSAK